MRLLPNLIIQLIEGIENPDFVHKCHVVGQQLVDERVDDGVELGTSHVGGYDWLDVEETGDHTESDVDAGVGENVRALVHCTKTFPEGCH